ncbi:MAG: hypothetical protein K2Q18_00290 [Bdellovibrionales bacterium]|nr:hypothetical protein [Bdellovibrionales bacterium]
MSTLVPENDQDKNVTNTPSNGSNTRAIIIVIGFIVMFIALIVFEVSTRK